MLKKIGQVCKNILALKFNLNSDYLLLAPAELTAAAQITRPNAILFIKSAKL